MPEDGLGFDFFSRDQRTFITNDHAVRKAGLILQDKVSNGAAFDFESRAFEAVTTAAERKALRYVDDQQKLAEPDEPDIPPFAEGADLLIF